MFKTCANYKNGNKEVVAVSLDGMYSVCAYVDGILVGSFDTEDITEAQEVYAYNCDLIA